LTAENLVYLKSPNEIVTASKGTQEYDEIIGLLRQTNYAHQADEK
jgi:hypothetical protein